MKTNKVQFEVQPLNLSKINGDSNNNNKNSFGYSDKVKSCIFYGNELEDDINTAPVKMKGYKKT